jgi:3-oxoacyl-[acyl-carrier-protein] synthase-1
MKRVVITGMGIVSSIGNNKTEVLNALKNNQSGIEFVPEYQELGFRSQVHGSVKLDIGSLIDRKWKRFMGDGAAFNYIAMREAITQAELGEQDIANPRTGLVMGSGGTSTANLLQSTDLLRSKGIRKVGPYMAVRTMSNSNSACLATAFQIKGVSYSISSACSTSAHCIGNAAELIQAGKQDIVFAGGGEEVHWTMSLLFDAMGAMSAKFNNAPQSASRPYDVNRDGFVISGGGGVLVLEELEHALNRGAPILAELVGYGATSDGYDMVQPSGEGAVRCMQQALATVDQKVDYINTHGTSTPVGDARELQAIGDVFGSNIPAISATKSLTGHALGAAGVNEAVYSLLMLQHGFIAASANIEELDPEAQNYPIVRETQDNLALNCVMSNSFGFGGTNACLVFQRFAG